MNEAVLVQVFEGESYLLGDALDLVPVSAYKRQYGGREEKRSRREVMKGGRE